MNMVIKCATALPVLALVSACSTMAPTMPMTQTTPVTDTMTTVAYDRMAPMPYTCTDNSQILAKQSINKKQATINVTAPKLNWSQQSIILNGDVSGNTANYVNESNPEVIYAWHMKDDRGIFAMKWADGNTYQLNCTM